MRLTTLTLFALVGCTSAELVDTRDLGSELQVSNARLTGVSVDPDDGMLVVTEASSGLWKLEPDGPRQLMNVQKLMNAGLPADITDVAALGGGAYAMTVPSIGVLFDERADSVGDFFCYEPGEWGDWEVQRQETFSLAYHSGSNTLISQPQTLTDDAPDRADVAEFDRGTGEPLAWHTLNDRKFVSTALALADSGVILAEGTDLYDYRLGDDRPTHRTDLRSLGLDSVDGMTVSDGMLLVVSGGALLSIEGF